VVSLPDGEGFLFLETTTLRNLIEDTRTQMGSSSKDAGHTMFSASLVEAFRALKSQKETRGLKLSNEILEINVLTKDGYGITITGCDKVGLRIGNFEIVKDEEFGEWGARTMLLRLLTRYMNRKRSDGRRLFHLGTTIEISDELLLGAGVTKRKAREQFMARVHGTTPENVHQELNKIYRARGKNKKRSVLPKQIPSEVREIQKTLKTAIAKGEIDEEGVAKKR
jgi:hypothetical protein